MARILTAFSWGYHGWGNAAKEFVRAADKIEKSRNHRPPIFVDIRYHRSVRAPGFRDKEFENALGKSRYVWMKELGNKSIREKTRRRTKIVDPRAAFELLDTIQSAQRTKRRIVFFCSCRLPHDDDKTCHRVEVRRLLLKAAKKRGVRLEIAEWPGGFLKGTLRKNVAANDFNKIINGAKSLRISANDLSLAGLPWRAVADFRSGENRAAVGIDPARCDKRGWFLPIFAVDQGLNFDRLRRNALLERRLMLLEPRRNY
jgi:hypothetical protein